MTYIDSYYNYFFLTIRYNKIKVTYKLKRAIIETNNSIVKNVCTSLCHHFLEFGHQISSYSCLHPTTLVINQEDVHESDVFRILLRWYTPYMSDMHFHLEISFPTSYSQKVCVSVGHSCSKQKQYTIS